ncbi:MAG: group III truncated hemoglobin [Acidobacteriota bacterium]
MTSTKTDIRDRADIDKLMLSFYSRALADPLIGFIFTDVAQLNLDHHLPVIGDFWETIVFQTGAYASHGRNPLMVHGELAGKTPLLPEHFQRWLVIFHETTDELFAGERANFIRDRAEAIAGRMKQYVAAVQSPNLNFPQAA